MYQLNLQTASSKLGLLFLGVLIAVTGLTRPIECQSEAAENDGEFCYRKEDCENDLHLFATNVSVSTRRSF